MPHPLPLPLILPIGIIATDATGEGQDLTDLDQLLTFHPNRTNEVICVNVSTFVDDLYEGPEVVGFVLTSEDGVTLSPREATLEILDNNRKQGASCLSHNFPLLSLLSCLVGKSSPTKPPKPD